MASEGETSMEPTTASLGESNTAVASHTATLVPGREASGAKECRVGGGGAAKLPKPAYENPVFFFSPSSLIKHYENQSILLTNQYDMCVLFLYTVSKTLGIT